MKMGCPVWKRGDCHSEICDHVDLHEEIIDQHGSVCRSKPLNKECEKCIEINDLKICSSDDTVEKFHKYTMRDDWGLSYDVRRFKQISNTALN